MIIECGNDIETVMSYMWILSLVVKNNQMNTRKSNKIHIPRFSDDSKTAKCREVRPERRLWARRQMDPDIVAEKQVVDDVAQLRVLSKSEHAIFIQC